MNALGRAQWKNDNRVKTKVKGSEGNPYKKDGGQELKKIRMGFPLGVVHSDKNRSFNIWNIVSF